MTLDVQQFGREKGQHGGGARSPGAAPAGTAGASRWKRGAKKATVLLLLLLLGGVSYITIYYLRTGEPISRMPGMPAPLSKVLQEPPIYRGSIYGATHPIGVAVSRDGLIYVTEGDGDRSIRVFDRAGQQVRAFFAPFTDAVSRVPVYDAIGPDGELYVTDRLSSTIQA